MTESFDIEKFRIPAQTPGANLRVAHTNWCAIHDEGPCTCDADEIYAELALEDFE